MLSVGYRRRRTQEQTFTLWPPSDFCGRRRIWESRFCISRTASSVGTGIMSMDSIMVRFRAASSEIMLSLIYPRSGWSWRACSRTGKSHLARGGGWGWRPARTWEGQSPLGRTGRRGTLPGRRSSRSPRCPPRCAGRSTTPPPPGRPAGQTGTAARQPEEQSFLVVPDFFVDAHFYGYHHFCFSSDE